MIRDLRVAARVLAKAPGFTLAAVVTLSLGIGANTAVFALVSALFLRPVPVTEPDRLIVVHNYHTTEGYYSSLPYPGYLDLRDRAADVASFAAYEQEAATIRLGSGARQVTAAFVTPNYFTVLGVAAARGRAMSPDLDDEGAPVVVLSDALWTQHFGADPAIVGRAVSVNGRPFTVIGVAPIAFRGLDVGSLCDLWLPVRWKDDDPRRFAFRGWHWLEGVGRLRPGVDETQAQAVVRAVSRQLGEEHPESDRSWTLRVSPGAQGNLYPHTRERLARLMAAFLAAAIVLVVIACANVANLFLTRAVARQREIHVRLAIGATRSRLLRQFLTEGALLASLGAAGGVLGALWVPGLLASFTLAGGIPIADLDLTIDARVLGFVAVLAALCGVAFGVAAGGQARDRDLAPALKGATISRPLHRSPLGRTLVVVQVGLSLMLLVGAGLLAKSLWNQLALDPGFRRQPLLIASIDPGARRYDAARGQAMYEALADRVRALPGVQVAAWSHVVPFGSLRMRLSVLAGNQADQISIDANVVSPSYFDALRIPLVDGRFFSERDGEGAPLVAIVNESMARRFWPGEPPIGKTLRWTRLAPPVTVVGVVKDTRYYDIRTLRGPQRAYLYVPLGQFYLDRMNLFVRAQSDPAAVLPALAAQVAAVDPELAIGTALTSSEQVDRALSQERLAAMIAVLFGALALVVAVVGLHGVLAYAASQRVREFGIRLSLGARRADLVRLVLREGMTLASAGLAVGLASALVLTRFLASLLYEVEPMDAPTFVATGVLVWAVALAACVLPARRAAAIDPVVALRTE